MKNIFKYLSTAASILAIGSLAVTSCEEPDYVSADTRFTSFGLSAQFKFVNASPDAPTMDFFVQGIEAGNDLAFGVAQNGYTRVPLASSLTSFGQVSLRGIGSSGNIGGTLGSAAAIFRAGNNNNNAFAPINRGRYTVFAVDSINRPRPLRKLSRRVVNGETVLFADATYYSSRKTFTAPKLSLPAGDTVIRLYENNPLDTFNIVRRYNGNVDPSFMKSIGTVPLGSSDPGGVRYYILQDSLQVFAIGNITQSAIRVVNLSPNNNVWVRLENTTDNGIPNISVASNQTYVMNLDGASSNGFSPAVGSRLFTVTSPNFPLRTTKSPTGGNYTYTIRVATNAGFTENVITLDGQSFDANKNYTIMVAGVAGKPSFTVKVISHN